MTSDQDQTHLNNLSTAHYVVGGVMMLFACFPLIHVFLGLGFILGSDALTTNAKSPPPPAFGWLFFIPGLLFFFLGQCVSVSVILSGRFIKQQRNYLFSFIVGCLACMAFPFGTVLGVFTIIVLSRDSVKAKYATVKNPPPDLPPSDL